MKQILRSPAAIASETYAAPLTPTSPSHERRARSFDLNLDVLGRLLFIMVALFGIADLATQVINDRAAPGFQAWVQLSKLVDLDREYALPTWYGIVLLFTIALALGAIARFAFQAREPFRWHWAVLSLIFLAFSIDEQVLGHESAGEILGDRLQSSGIFYYAWVIPAMGAVALVGIAFLPFLRSLDARTRRLILLAGGLYVGGAMGMEMLSGLAADQRGLDSLLYMTLTSIEEILELSGLSLFLIVVVGELRRRAPAITLQLGG